MYQMSVRVMVVEDEKEVRDEYRKLIEESNTLHLIAETDSSEEALQILETTRIDAILLDLELPKGSGVLFLEKLQRMAMPKPFVAVVTNVVSKVVYSTIRDMGADYICAKGDADFSLAVPLSIIEISAPYQQAKENEAIISKSLNKRTKYDIYHRKIEYEHAKMGFSAKLQGTTFSIESLLYMAMAETQEISIMKDVYTHVAEKYGTTPTNVERSIRMAIEKVWMEQEIGKLRELYPYEWNADTGRPTNAEFLWNMKQRIIRY